MIADHAPVDRPGNLNRIEPVGWNFVISLRENAGDHEAGTQSRQGELARSTEIRIDKVRMDQDGCRDGVGAAPNLALGACGLPQQEEHQ